MKLDLERLREELPGKRWFVDKQRRISTVEVVDHGTLEDGDEALVLVLLDVSFADGSTVTYHLPLLVTAEGSFRDATEDPDRLRMLGEVLAHGHPVKGERGIFHFSGPGLDPGNPPGAGSLWTIGAEQSNTSVVFDDSMILKFFRKVEPGPNPDLELTRLLTNEGFRWIPPQVGEIFYEEMREEETTGPEEDDPISIDLGIAQTFIAGGREGWEFTLEHLGTLLDQIHEADVAEDRPTLIEERAGDLLTTIEQLGDATASLHVALAREDFEPEFRPEPVTEDDLRHWADGATERFRRLAAQTPELEALREGVVPALASIADLNDAGQRIRIHGDYHLGQVLRVPRTWYLIDFEGEPARSLEERRAKHSPLKDVAGMLRSLSYAAYATLLRRAEPGSDGWDHIEPWAFTWEELARERFLTAYIAKSHEGRFAPPDPEALTTLLGFFELDKAIYEVGYELSARPDWVGIPLRGIKRVVERGEDH